MCSGVRITKKQKSLFISRLVPNFGNVSKSAEEAGFCRKAAYDQKKADPEFSEAWDSAIETLGDAVESAFHEVCLSGNPQALIYWLKTKGQARGYVEKQHFEGTITQANIIVRDEATKAALEGLE